MTSSTGPRLGQVIVSRRKHSAIGLTKSSPVNLAIFRAPRYAILLALVVLAVLAGCGAPGEPEPVVSPESLAQSPALAKLMVMADPPGAEVYLDGKLRGQSPITFTLAAGEYQVALHADGYLPLTDTIALSPGQEGTITPTLAPVEIDIVPSAEQASEATGVAAVVPTIQAEPATATLTPPTPDVASAPTDAPTLKPTVAAPTAIPTPVAVTRLSIIEVSLPTYPYTRFVRADIDPTLDNYPILTLDRPAYEASNPVPVPVTYTLIVLENDYLRLSILPDLGGRVYECVFKPTGNNEFYKNPVIKPTSWGPPSPPYPAGANWWLGMGGLEWGFPVEEHGYEWNSRWGHDHVALPDGGAMVSVFTRDPRRPYVVVDIILPPTAAYFTVRPMIVNSWGGPFRFKWWANAMLAPGAANTPGPDLHFIFPVSQMTVHSTGDPDLPGSGQTLSWPIHNGRDLSRLGNWNGYLGVFQSPSAQGDYMGVYDTAADEGMMRVYPSAIARGAKGFSAGLNGSIDPDNWTDDGSVYVELHGGLSPTFGDWYELGPGAEISWTETWYPVAGIGGVTYAAESGALHLARSGDGLQVRFFPTRALRGTLTATLPGLASSVQQVNISPAQPLSEVIGYTDAVPGSGEVAITLTNEQGGVVFEWRGGVMLR
jgi:hypothetical protein